MNACDFAANPFARPDPIHSTQTPWGHTVGCRVSRVGCALPCAALGAVSRLLYIWHLHIDTAVSYVSLTKNSSLKTSCNGSFYIIYPYIHAYIHTYNNTSYFCGVACGGLWFFPWTPFDSIFSTRPFLLLSLICFAPRSQTASSTEDQTLWTAQVLGRWFRAQDVLSSNLSSLTYQIQCVLGPPPHSSLTNQKHGNLTNHSLCDTCAFVQHIVPASAERFYLSSQAPGNRFPHKR